MSDDDTMPMGSTPRALNAEDHDQIEVATLQAQRREQIEDADLAEVFATDAGRRFITRVLRMTGIQAMSPADPVGCQRSEGARSVGLAILDILGAHSIHAYPQLLVEEALRVERERKERAAALVERQRAEEHAPMPWLKPSPDPTL